MALRRRTLLGLGTVLVGGCSALESARSAPNGGHPTTTGPPSPTPAGERPPPAYDCHAAHRPTPSTADPSEEQAYPSPPASLSEEQRVVEFVAAYERAYRRNALRATHGEHLRDVGVSVNDQWVHDASAGSAVVRLRYAYFYTVGRPDETPIHADSPVTYVSYYLDEAVAIRAVDEGLREDESALDPDPWDTGSPVACFR